MTQQTTRTARAAHLTPAEKKQVTYLRRFQGALQQEITDEFGIARSTVSAYFTDPVGAMAKARKDSYRGACIDCGGPTTGSDGRKKAPQRCQKCSLDLQSRERRWTREAIIDAIQRFAAIHGRPPTSTEWNRPRELRGGDYPGATIIYKPAGPFNNWADAIEAAGFPRPLPGQYDRCDPRYRGSHCNDTPRRPRRYVKTEGRSFEVGQYIVFVEVATETWEQHGPREAFSEALAIEELCAELEISSGRFFAISAARVTVRTLQPVTTVKAVAE